MARPDAGPRPAARLEQLTALRFFAALAVLASHLSLLEERDNPLRWLAGTVLHEGYWGVSFFFVLSGYILCHTYQARLADGRIGRGRFLLLRLARIWPLHVMVAVPLALYQWRVVGGAALPFILTNLALIHGWIPSTRYYGSLNGPSWSLSDELFFYVAFAWLACWPLRQLAGLAAVLLVACTLLATGFWASGHAAIREDGVIGVSYWATAIFPPTRLLDFVAGMLLYRLPRRQRGAVRATGWELGSIGLLLAAAITYTLLNLPPVLRAQILYLPIMILLVHTFVQGEGLIARCLARSRTLVLLGEASFALYLIHVPIIRRVIAWYEAASSPVPLVLAMALTGVACVGLSIPVHKLLEKPIHDWLKRMIMRLPLRLISRAGKGDAA